MKSGKEDESLSKQFAALGIEKLDQSAITGDDPFVQIISLHVLSPQHPDGGFEMKEVGRDKEGIMEYAPYTVKEGCDVKFRVIFKVYNNTVLQLSFTGEIYYMTKALKVDEWDEPLGNFAPVDQEQTVEFAEATMPKGMAKRMGTYYGSGQFVDAEDRIHMMFKYNISLGKEWK